MISCLCAIRERNQRSPSSYPDLRTHEPQMEPRRVCAEQTYLVQGRRGLSRPRQRRGTIPQVGRSVLLRASCAEGRDDRLPYIRTTPFVSVAVAADQTLLFP